MYVIQCAMIRKPQHAWLISLHASKGHNPFLYYAYNPAARLPQSSFAIVLLP